MSRRAVCLAVSLLTLAFARTADAVEYRFKAVATSGAQFDAFGFGAPVLNNQGIVAYTATLTKNGVEGIFRSIPGVERRIIALESEPPFQFSRFGDPTINDLGFVGFEASTRVPRGEGIFLGTVGPDIRLAGTRNAGDFDFVNASPSLNDSGNIAFIGERIVGDDFIDGVWLASVSTVVPVYDETGPFDDFIGNPSLNNSGQVAFLGVLDSGVSGLFLGSGGAFTTIVDDTGDFVEAFGFSDPALNDAGQVAFRAGTTIDPNDPNGATAEGIFLYSNGTVTPILQGGFDQFAFFGDPAINNLGTVAFIVAPTFEQQILVTGPDLVEDKVIATGDRLYGRTVVGLAFSREGINDQGQVAFTAFFDDGTSGVFIATPRQ